MEIVSIVSATITVVAVILSSALTYHPQVRGQWSEMQVERVLELSGLTKGQHGYETQFIVHMPHKLDIILDSKVPLTADNAETDKEREDRLQRHASAVKKHALNLASKGYQRGLLDSADFVAMVVPEFVLPPALERDPNLLDRALQDQVVIVTYSTLVALLKCVAMGWQERTVADEALQIGELGKELYDRLSVFAGHLTGVGTALGNAVEKYNKGIGSYEHFVMPQAKRFLSLGGEGGERNAEVAGGGKLCSFVKATSGFQF